MQDFDKALSLMRESDYINYSTLGLDYVLCRFFILYNLAIIKQVLGLKEMAMENVRMAHATKARMEADKEIKSIAAEPLSVCLYGLVWGG